MNPWNSVVNEFKRKVESYVPPSRYRTKEGYENIPPTKVEPNIYRWVTMDGTEKFKILVRKITLYSYSLEEARTLKEYLQENWEEILKNGHIGRANVPGREI